ncbi:MAG TPA: glucose 1-dehydrogenase [Anaerolineae bacterium]|nr:glucose 1-dehydrogenase [Anaerolineae bacterium]
MADKGKLEGKLALVTGSGTGLGKAIALEFARQGADVVLHYNRSAKGAHEAVEEIRAMGKRSTVIQADLSNVDECFRLVDESVDFLGGIDVLMNNAGITASGPFQEVTPEQFDLLYHVNVRGEYFCAQRAVKHMLKRKQRGVIINMTSVHGLAGIPLHSIYAGTKGAIIAWTRELAVEMAPLGIRVNAVAPGWIAVESHYQQIPNFDPEKLGYMIPWGRLGVPADIAKACVYLASDDSDFMVGSVLLIDGGTIAKMALPLETMNIDFKDTHAN